MDGIYLYGIMRDPGEVDLGIAGLDVASALSTVAHDGLACLVSEYHGKPFEEMAKTTLLQSLLAHQRAIEGVMQEHTVLPVKFGTIVRGARDAVELLSQGHSQFVEALDSIEGNVQVEVAATWDTDQVLQKIGKEEEVVCARQAVSRNGGPTVEERVQLGRMVKAQLEQWRDSYRERILMFLEPLSLAVAPNALVSDQLVMNVALLLNRNRLEEFDTVMQRVDRLVGAEINFRVLCPLPPYSFSTVEITRITQEQLDEARQTLRLADVVSAADVRQAYRRLVADMVGCPGLGDNPAKAQLKRLRQASELLLQCCQKQDAGQQEEKGSARFRRSGECRFLIAIQGSGSDEIEPARFGKSEGAE